MRHPFRYLSLSKPKNSPHSAQRGAPALGFKGFPFDKEPGGQQTWATAARRHRHREKAGGQQQGRGTQQTRFYSSSDQWLQPHKKTAAAQPTTEKTAEEGWAHTQRKQYINTERTAYDGVTPVIEQMRPEIAQADENTKNTQTRGKCSRSRGGFSS